MTKAQIDPKVEGATVEAKLLDNILKIVLY